MTLTKECLKQRQRAFDSRIPAAEKSDKITLAEFDRGLGQVLPKDLDTLWSLQQEKAVCCFMEASSPQFARARAGGHAGRLYPLLNLILPLETIPDKR